MKHIKIIGIGMGDEASMTIAAREWLGECELLIGASRMLQAASAVCNTDGKECVTAWQPKDIRSAIWQSRAEKIAVLMSGDIGFFSGARALREEIESQSPHEFAGTASHGSEKEMHTENGKEAVGDAETAKDTGKNVNRTDVRNVTEDGNNAGAMNDIDTCEYEISWLPGISSMAYFCNAIGIPYEDVYALSIHGRSGPYIRQIAIHEKTFLLTDGDLPGLGRKLVNYGLENVTVWVGMDLAASSQKVFKATPEKKTTQQIFKGTPEEETTQQIFEAHPEEESALQAENISSQKIFKMTPSELAQFPKENCRPLTVCLILNPDAERLRNPYRLDGEFCRDGKTPMTKEEVRGIILGKLRPESRDVIYDIGGGSGSVSVACAIAASCGTVYSVECDADAAKLIDENRRRFACDNVEIIAGHAPEALQGLPMPDRVFIGGSGGELAGILREIENRIGLTNNPSWELKKRPDSTRERAGETKKSIDRVKESIGETKESIGGVKESIKETKESIGGMKESTGETKGSSGGVKESIEETAKVIGKTKKTRIVISSVTLETSAEVSSYIHASPYVKNAEVCQLAVAKSKKLGSSTLMMGQNPVMIFSFDLTCDDVDDAV